MCKDSFNGDSDIASTANNKADSSLQTDKHTDDSRSVGDSSLRATQVSPNAATTRLLSDPTCMTTGSDSNSVSESKPTCSDDTAKLKEEEMAEVEKIAVEREYSLHQVKSFTQDRRDNPKLKKKRLDSVEDKTRNIKLTKVVYNTTSKQLLAKSEDFVFTFDCVKAMTLYWNIIKDKPDMTAAATESLRIIEVSTQVSWMHYRHEIEHMTKDLHVFMDLVWCYLQK